MWKTPQFAVNVSFDQNIRIEAYRNLIGTFTPKVKVGIMHFGALINPLPQLFKIFC